VVQFETTTVSGEDTGASSVDRGKYLVHSVAQCIQCHTPRDSRGNLDVNRLLEGAPIPMESPFPNSPWAFQAPAIAGLPGWSAADVTHLLMTGRRVSGQQPRPPMPQFQMSLEDAESVVSYLKSLH
jgi:mono/diheme cytochrome c family protein